MLKKQTVWLLTMLSLMIVLSVYYMTSPGGGSEFTYVDDGEDQSEEQASSDTTDENTDGDTDANSDNTNANVDDISQLGEDELFTSIRMEIQNERSKTKDRLDDVVASSTASVEEKNQARDEMNQLDEISRKESVLEDTIMAAADYSDVLVRHDDNKVVVHVQEKEQLSNSEVANIMQMVRDEFGKITVKVSQQGSEK